MSTDKATKTAEASMRVATSSLAFYFGLVAVLSPSWVDAFAPPTFVRISQESKTVMLASLNDDGNSSGGRRNFLVSAVTQASFAGGILGLGRPSCAEEKIRSSDSLDIENFLNTGMVAQPMGVSGQAGKSRPETGIVLRDGTEVSRNRKTGDVLAEIVLGSRSDLTAVLTSFNSELPLATGGLFDVECRDAKSGDGVFLAVTSSTGGKSIDSLPNSFFLDQLFKPTGRFSFYGSPTDVKVKKSTVTDGGYRIMEMSFSNLSQSTQTEIPRNAIMKAVVPSGTDQAVMLVASATAARWKKGAEDSARKTVASFSAAAAPKSALKVRAKEKNENF